jgi:hypothetical protein
LYHKQTGAAIIERATFLKARLRRRVGASLHLGRILEALDSATSFLEGLP